MRRVHCSSTQFGIRYPMAEVESRSLALDRLNARPRRPWAARSLAPNIVVAPSWDVLCADKALVLGAKIAGRSVPAFEAAWHGRANRGETSGFTVAQDVGDVFATELRRPRNAKGLSRDDLAYEAEVNPAI